MTDFRIETPAKAVSGTAPIVVTSGVISISNAQADGATIGAAGFSATDFTASSGIISLSNTTNPLALQVFS